MGMIDTSHLITIAFSIFNVKTILIHLRWGKTCEEDNIPSFENNLQSKLLIYQLVSIITDGTVSMIGHKKWVTFSLPRL